MLFRFVWGFSLWYCMVNQLWIRYIQVDRCDFCYIEPRKPIVPCAKTSIWCAITTTEWEHFLRLWSPKVLSTACTAPRDKGRRRQQTLQEFDFAKRNETKHDLLNETAKTKRNIEHWKSLTPGKYQSRTQSLLAFWSARQRDGSRWGHQISTAISCLESRVPYCACLLVKGNEDAG